MAPTPWLATRPPWRGLEGSSWETGFGRRSDELDKATPHSANAKMLRATNLFASCFKMVAEVAVFYDDLFDDGNTQRVRIIIVALKQRHSLAPY